MENEFETYDFDQVIDRTGTAALKWEKYEGTDILPMWVADMDFKTPPPVAQALKERIDHELFGYTLVPDQLNRVVVQRMKQLYDWTIQPGWILWLPGVVSALNVACTAFGGPGNAVVTTTPIYPPFLSAPSNCGRQLIRVPMIEDNLRATLDFASLEAAFRQGAGLFMFCSPYNPCGTVFTREEIKELVSLCRQYNVVLCSDEIHADFVLDGQNRHIPTASVSKEAQNRTITLMAPSKTYNIPGLGASFAIIPDPELRHQFTKHSAGVVPHVNLLGLTAARAAYEHCDGWIKQLIAYLRTNRDMVYERVNRMKGCRMLLPEATYLAWIDVTQTGLNHPAVFFDQAGVGLSDGKDFGLKGFVRLNFGCPKSLLKKGLDRMETALGSL